MRRSTSSRWSSTTFSRSSTPRSRRRDGRSRITSWRSAAVPVKPCRRAITSAKHTARAAQPTSPSSRSWASATNSAAAWGLMPADKAVVFLQNHDTQHQCGIGYRDGNTFRLANVWMLAQPYGYPSILSSYAFDCPAGNDMGPPSDANGNTNDVTCAVSLETATVGQWVCEHRDPYIRSMVSFRRVVAGSDINHWWDDGANAIA